MKTVFVRNAFFLMLASAALLIACSKSDTTPEDSKQFKTTDFEVTLISLKVDGQLFADFNVKNLKDIDYNRVENGSFKILGKAKTPDGEFYEGDTPIPEMSAGASATTFTLVISHPGGIDQSTFTYEVVEND